MGVDALATYDQQVSDLPVILGATPGGFVFEHNGGTGHMMEVTAIGVENTTVASSSGLAVTLSAPGAHQKDGPADVPFVVTDSDGLVTGEGYIVESTSRTVMRTAFTGDINGIDDDESIALGGYIPTWKSKWFDAGQPDRRKKWHKLNLTTTPGTSNTLTVKIYIDLGTTAHKTITGVSLSSGIVEIPLGGIRATYLMVELISPGRNRDFRIHDMSFKWAMADQR